MSRRLQGVPKWLRSTVIGGLLGVCIGLGGAMRARSELLPGEELTYGYGESVIFGMIAGLAGGGAHYATRRLRRRDSGRFYLSWALVGVVAMGTALLPGFFSEPSVPLFVIWLLVGSGGGLGLGWTDRRIRAVPNKGLQGTPGCP